MHTDGSYDTSLQVTDWYSMGSLDFAVCPVTTDCYEISNNMLVFYLQVIHSMACGCRAGNLGLWLFVCATRNISCISYPVVLLNSVPHT